MTDQQHPITPPPELVAQWASKSFVTQHLCTQIAQWGADQELEACVNWLEDADLDDSQKVSWVNLRAARRPKPPSLKERIAAAITEGDERTALLLLNEALPND